MQMRTPVTYSALSGPSSGLSVSYLDKLFLRLVTAVVDSDFKLQSVARC